VMPYEPSLREDSSRIDTAEAHEARQAFSTFDQGPLEDMPAFVPDSPSITHSETEDATLQVPVPKTKAIATPTPAPTAVSAQVPVQAPTPVRAPMRAPIPVPVAERSMMAAPAPVKASVPEKAPAQAPATVSTPAAEPSREPVPVQDRWAQIRKNAAERAAQRQTEEQHVPVQKAESAATEEGETSGEESKAKPKKF
jgi:hypothetical protein